jgi:hypothetical protein
MASRESQGLQVALILFVMVTVVLAITTYVYFRKSEEKIKEAKSAVAQAQQAKGMYDTVQFENQILKHVLGYERKTEPEVATIKAALGNNAKMDEVLNNFDQEMGDYGAGLAKDDLHYRNLPKHLLTMIQERNSQLADANDQVKAFEAQKNQLVAVEQKKVTVAEKGQDEAQKDLLGEREKFAQARTAVTTQSTDVAKKMADKDKANQVASATMQKDKEELQKRLDLVEQLATTYKQRLDKATADKPVERAAGEVKWVDQRSNMVWINLGTVDGVQRQMTFSVIDQKETAVGGAKIKGRIEVTRVMEDHTAEARIIENPMSDPIMQGDKVFSPTFKKGQRTHFAMAGIMDIDRDGKNDQARVRAVITMNGGEVDAELQEDGSIAGKMTSETQYLVQGQKPTDKTNVKLTEGYTKMVEEASRLGIQPMTVDKLLDKMGYTAEKRVTDMSRGGSGGAGGTAAKKDSFRKRTP